MRCFDLKLLSLLSEGYRRKAVSAQQKSQLLKNWTMACSKENIHDMLAVLRNIEDLCPDDMWRAIDALENEILEY